MFGDKEKMRKARIEAEKHRKAVIADFIESSPDHLRNYFKGLPDTYKWNWLMSFIGKNSIQKAAKAKCIDCSGYDRNEMYNCSVVTCPLHKYRPRQK
jgi:hypothetical protein